MNNLRGIYTLIRNTTLSKLVFVPFGKEVYSPRNDFCLIRIILLLEKNLFSQGVRCDRKPTRSH